MELDPEILEDLECKVCTEIMHPPIRMCILGHSFCGNCADKVRTCPVCREPKSYGRNYALENIHNKVMLPCKYQPEGCTSTMLGVEIKEHEEFCDHAHMQCPLKSINNCSWSGKIKDLVAHATEAHPSNMFCTNEQKLIYPQFLVANRNCVSCSRPVSDCFVMLFQAFGHLFKCVLNMNPRTGLIKWCVYFFGPREDAKNYYFKIECGNNEQRVETLELTLACQPKTIALFEQENHIVTHVDMMKQFCKSTDLHYSVSIYQTEASSGAQDGGSAPGASVVPEPCRFLAIDDPNAEFARMLWFMYH